MKEGQVVVGTVRSKIDENNYVVVLKDGINMNYEFTGDIRPLIGSDIVGRLHFNDIGKPVMTLKNNLLEAIMEGSHRIYMMGSRPDMTAVMAAKLLARSRSAVVSPGSGSYMERNPVSYDPNLDWAFSHFIQESERRGIAMNVIDVQSLARSHWDKNILKEMALPADQSDNLESMFDFTTILRQGMKPTCSRLVHEFEGDKEISLNFIVPYSPFQAVFSYCIDMAAMGTQAFPVTRMHITESRRFSSASMIALGLSHNYLGATDNMQVDVDSNSRSRHLSSCFADAVATMLFLRDGGRSSVIAEIADLKESSLYYGIDKLIPDNNNVEKKIFEKATHKAIRMAMSTEIDDDTTTYEILKIAARIAKKTAFPANRFLDCMITEKELASAKKVASNIGMNLKDASPEIIEYAKEYYKNEISSLFEEYDSDVNAKVRLYTYEKNRVPEIFEESFLEITQGISDHITPENNAKRDKLADRIKSRTQKDTSEDALQFGESMIAINQPKF